MRNEEELNRIASGIVSGDIFTAQDITDLNDLKVTFPGILNLTLGEALEMLNRDVHTVFQWNGKKRDGVFVDWEEITVEEWRRVHEIIESAPKRQKKANNKRRLWRHGKKRQSHQGA